MAAARSSRALVFLAGAVLGGLALALGLWVLRPDLLGGTTPAATQPAPPGDTSAKPPDVTSTDAATDAPAGPTPPPARVAPVASYASAVERASPAVVNIYTSRRVTERLPPSSLRELFGDLPPRYRQRVQNSLGSGVLVDARGHIVTNHHVIADADEIWVQLADSRVGEARIVGRDPDTDLAVLQISLDQLPVMPLGRSDRLRVGDVVLAIGNPVGLSQTVTQGIVSATGRGQLGVAIFENFIQTDAPINFGNSGGALINASGELVGINTAVLSKNLGVEGIGFAIPVNLVRGVLDEIVRNGRVIRGWVGVTPEQITDAQARQFGLPRGGLVVAALTVGGPAQRAGLRPGDIIESVGGAPATTAQDVLARVAGARPGSTLPIVAVRGEERIEFDVTVAERPVGR
jgi:serine peptidase DegS